MTSANVRILYCHLPHHITQEQYEFLKAGLPQSILSSHTEYRQLKDAFASLLGLVLLQQLLPEFGFEQSYLKNLSYSLLGKPLLPNLYFNYSHSFEMVVCAASADCNVGVDTEKIRDLEWDEYNFCFSEDEKKRFPENQYFKDFFFELWTKKESLIKADGRAMRIEMNTVNIDSDKGSITGEEAVWYFTSLNTFPGYITHLCTALPSVCTVNHFAQL
jgi:4'-phosphopantetheinyl transferase